MPPTPLKNRPQTARLNSWQKSVTKQSTIRKIYITSVDKQTEDHPNMAEFSRTPKTAEIFRKFPTSLTLPCSHSARGNSPNPSGRRAPTLILSFFTRALSVTNSDAKRNRNQNKYGARRKHGFPPTAKKKKTLATNCFRVVVYIFGHRISRAGLAWREFWWVEFAQYGGGNVRKLDSGRHEHSDGSCQVLKANLTWRTIFRRTEKTRHPCWHPVGFGCHCWCVEKGWWMVGLLFFAQCQK